MDLRVVDGDRVAALDALHELRLRELLRIAARDLARLGTLEEILAELSNVADVFLNRLYRILWKELTDRFGVPSASKARREIGPHSILHSWARQAWRTGTQLQLRRRSPLRLRRGRQHVSKSPQSKIPPPPAVEQALPNYQFFKRLAEGIIREGTARGVDGGALRIDMRLRPEGNSGPLARSLDSYENFYAEWGQTWERMMLIKARRVAGNETLAGSSRSHPAVPIPAIRQRRLVA